MKIVLVTGSSGFLGRFLVKKLKKNGVDVVELSSKNCDLTNKEDLKKIPLKKYDHIFHLAAWTQAGDFCEFHSGEQWIINQEINTNILSWWRNNCPTAKMIAFGTSVSYAPENELNEANYDLGSPIDKFKAYAMSKRMLLVGLECMKKQFNMNYLYVIPSTLYGPEYHNDGRQLHFIYDIIRKILDGKKYNKEVELWGDGYQRRELVNVEDFIEILLQLNNIASNEIFNIGAGQDFSIRDFVKIVCEKIDFDMKLIKYNTNAYVGAKSKILNIDKISNRIEYKQKPIEVGICETIEWMKKIIN
jgi:GDP-L-fucose synthase